MIKISHKCVCSEHLNTRRKKKKIYLTINNKNKKIKLNFRKMASCSNTDGPDPARNMIKMNWNPLKIEGRQFSFKCIFNESVVELLLFDIHELSLFFYVQNQDQIVESFKASIS